MFLHRYEVRAYRLGRLPGICLLSIPIMLGRITAEASSSDRADRIFRGASGVGIGSKPQRKNSALNKPCDLMSCSKALCLFFFGKFNTREHLNLGTHPQRLR